MSQSLNGAIVEIQRLVSELTGIKIAPPEITESVGEFPASLCYANTGTYGTQSAGMIEGLHTLVCEIHIARGMLVGAIKQAMPYAEAFPQKIFASPKLADTVSTINEIRYGFGELKYSGHITIGYRFEIDVKIEITT